MLWAYISCGTHCGITIIMNILISIYCTGGVDYGNFDNTQITLPAGKTVVEINITVMDDDFIETSEAFSGMLSLVTGDVRVLIDSDANTATVTILDEADSMFLQKIIIIIYYILYLIILIIIYIFIYLFIFK